MTNTQKLLKALADGGSIPTLSCCATNTQKLIYDAVIRVNNLDEEVQELKNNPDVSDIVGTYQDLENYDTQSLSDGAVIRVLTDETHDNGSSYYRWDEETQTWTYIGSFNPVAIRNHTLYL